jgi:hypothetical protein
MDPAKRSGRGVPHHVTASPAFSVFADFGEDVVHAVDAANGEPYTLTSG